MRVTERPLLDVQMRRVESLPALRRRNAALEAERNVQHRTIAWQFTCPDAREKPSHLDPFAQLRT